jgi:hypothetical protein
MTLTKIIRVAGELVNDRGVDRMAIVTYVNLLQRASSQDIFRLHEPPHLPAVSSIIKYLRGNSGDDVIVTMGSTTLATARMIQSCLRAKRSASRTGRE